MIDQRFALLALVFNAVGITFYIRKTLRGEIKPHPVTWMLWMTVPLIALVAQVGAGVGLPALITLAVAINPAIVLALLTRYPKLRWSVTVSDVVCGIVAASALVAWVAFRDTEIAIGLAISADAIAAIPTYKKAWSNPESESAFLYGCLVVSASITLLSVPSFDFRNYGFAAYLGVLGLSLSLVIVLRGRFRRVDNVGSVRTNAT